MPTVTSTEMELKLLNVARASLKELKEDYLDYLRRHALALWDVKHPRYALKAENNRLGQEIESLKRELMARKVC